ncbi:NADPH oxidoreductase [Spironucleus salmonicida]|uniref:NADPH oxidoreductase n=1 Tax=Spironucleus salmonicida TaxID=348837 RepID=V6LLE0_9EUKA|nr:NADPH oxidoreductase [Spironucleus salmonicida]|eukprot:EST41494.1 NADPH oxidoreductase [Spironucleus salmonicida]
MKTLIYFMHPEAEKSVRGRQILDTLKFKTNITIRELSTIYKKRPSFTPEEIKAEQEIILQHDRMIFMYPMFWYNMPAYGRTFLDNLFTVGFAYIEGAETNAKLEGKKFKCIATLGATSEFFVAESLGTPEMIQCQMKALCLFTGMKYEGSDFYFAEDGDEKVAKICAAFD